MRKVSGVPAIITAKQVAALAVRAERVIPGWRPQCRNGQRTRIFDIHHQAADHEQAERGEEGHLSVSDGLRRR